MSVVAIIPARKGSVRLPNKNRKILSGLPLIDWSINTAKKLQFLDDIIITTNDKIILKRLKKKGEFIKIFNRPEKLCKNNTKMIDVIIHTIKSYEKKFKKIKTVLLLQPTSPIRSLKMINLGYKIYKNFNKKKSIVSVSKGASPSKRLFEIKKKFLKLYRGKKSINSVFQINGNFYFASVNFLKKYKSFFYDGNTHPIIMKSKRLAIDIDTIKDFNKVKKYFKINE